MISEENFSKEERLLKTKDFRRVYNKGISFRRESAILYNLPNGLSENRIGISIGSRNVKLATRRNRLKRLFKEVYRRNKGMLKKGFDIVIVLKKDLKKKNATFEDAKEIFLNLANKAGLIG